MKTIKYYLKYKINTGTEENPVWEETQGPECSMQYSEANMAIAQAEAFGDITIEYGEVTQEEVIAAMSEACEQTIFAGIDVVLSDEGTHHFSLDVKDQINIMVLQSKLLSGAESITYHADDGKCMFYSAEDFKKIADSATAWKLYHESYFNSLREYIKSLNTNEELGDVEYGMEIPEEYQTDVFRQLTGGDQN